MTLPNHADKYGSPAVFDPEDALVAQGEGVPKVPPAIILGYQSELHEAVRERATGPRTLVRSQKWYELDDGVGYVPVSEVGIGAPVTAIVTENCIAAGAETVVLVGGSACLQPDVPPDAAVLPTETIRDEGVSHHYVPSPQSLSPTTSLVEQLDSSLVDAGFDTVRGETWTTSAMYRETETEVERYRDEGVVTLCMETAALWAVCEYRGVDTATVHEVGDYLAPDEWTPTSGGERGLSEMLSPVADGLTDYTADEDT